MRKILGEGLALGFGIAGIAVLTVSWYGILLLGLMVVTWRVTR